MCPTAGQKKKRERMKNKNEQLRLCLVLWWEIISDALRMIVVKANEAQ